VCVRVSVCVHSHGRISWSIFSKSGTEITIPKSKNEFVVDQHRTTPSPILPPKAHFWGVNRCFWSLTRQILELAYFRNYHIDSNQILHIDKDHLIPSVSGPNMHITNPRWLTAAILENLPCLSNGWRIAVKFGTAMQFDHLHHSNH